MLLPSHRHFGVHSNIESVLRIQILAPDLLLFTSFENLSKLYFNSSEPHFPHMKMEIIIGSTSWCSLEDLKK